MHEQENKEEDKVLDSVIEISNTNFIIPTCCREGWKNCPHTVKRIKNTKTNIGL